MESILFKPIYKERIWGGRELNNFLKRKNMPENLKIGESWEIVDRIQDQSCVDNGLFKSNSLRNLIINYSNDIMGKNWNKIQPFPVLIKWLNCQHKLSLQVHPPLEIANDLKGEPKSENWYVVESFNNSSLMVGIKKNVTLSKFKKAYSENNLENCINEYKVEKGDSLFIPSGLCHAIGGGNIILEIQQNSDTTYRLYDWGRIDINGVSRELHKEKAIKSIKFNETEPIIIKTKNKKEKVLLVDSKEFKIEKIYIQNKDNSISFKKAEEPKIISVLSGEIRINSKIYVLGDNILLPYAGEFSIQSITKEATFILTSKFSNN